LGDVWPDCNQHRCAKPRPKPQSSLSVLSYILVNGNFTVNINQYTSFQALDWLSKANSTVHTRLRAPAWRLFLTILRQIVTIDQSSTASSLAESGYNVRPVDTVNLQAVS
jgi:hypothetical protein